MKNILFVFFAISISLNAFADNGRDHRDHDLYCDGVYLKNTKGEQLAYDVDCVNKLLKPSKDGLFCDGIYLKTIEGKVLAYDVDCINKLLKPSKNGLFCDGIYLKTIEGKELAYDVDCINKFLSH